MFLLQCIILLSVNAINVRFVKSATLSEIKAERSLEIIDAVKLCFEERSNSIKLKSKKGGQIASTFRHTSPITTIDKIIDTNDARYFTNVNTYTTICI